MEVVNTRRICQRFSAAAQTYSRHATAQQQICVHLLNLLRQQQRLSFSRVLEIGCGSGGFTQLLRTAGQVDEWCLNDLCESWSDELALHMAGEQWHWFGGDAEQLLFPGSFDLIVSANALQWMQDLPAFLHRLSSSLRSQGLLLFNLFTPQNLAEIRLLTGEGLHYPQPEEVIHWLERDYQLLHHEEERITLHFTDPMEVLRHLKYTGVTANASGTWTKGKQMRFCEEYRNCFSTDDGQVTLTYTPVYLLAIKQ